MHGLLQDLRYAWRGFARMRGLAVVAFATLALGIAAATTMFSVVYGALLRPLPFDDSDRLVLVFQTRATPREGLTRLRWSWPNFTALGSASTSFENVASFTRAQIAIADVASRGSAGSAPEQIEGEVVSSEYFRALRVAPRAGRTFTADDDALDRAAAVTIISDRLWKRRFAADPAAVGRALRVNDIPLTIAGIMPEGFAGLSGKAELWISPPMAARLTYTDYLTTPQNFISVLARLKDGVTLASANAELSAIGPRFSGEESDPGTSWSAVAATIAEARIDATARRSAFVLFGAAGCMLLIACTNVANLFLGWGRTRRREIALRLALGSSRGRLIRQLLTEGLLLAAISGAAGVVLSAWGMDWIANTAPDVIPSFRNNYGALGAFGRPALDGGVLLFALAATLGTTVLFALAPALASSRPRLAGTLREDSRVGPRRARTFSLLVIGEVALASLLLTAAGMLIESFARIQDLRVGFDADRVLTFWVRPPTSRYRYPDDGPAIVNRLLTRIQAVAGVESAAANRCTPFTGCSRTIAFFPDRPVDPATAPGVGRHYASADYFRTLGIPLLAGRLLTDADREGTRPVALVNETGARRFWPGQNPIGQRVWFGTTTGPFSDRTRAVEIVGVVGDVKYEGVDQPEPQRADFYTSYLQFAYPDTMFIVKARGPATALVSALRNAVAAVDPALPIYDVMTLDERIDAAVGRPRFNTALLSAFAAAALLLAAIGVYGVLSYSVWSRLREIGVRLALGADPGRVTTMVLAEGLSLTTIGAAIGLAAALATSRVMQGVMTGVAGVSPPIAASSALLMVLVAAVAAFLPARRASRVDPVDVLRQE